MRVGVISIYHESNARTRPSIVMDMDMEMQKGVHPPHHTSLPVLRHSGKVEQLREELKQEREQRPPMTADADAPSTAASAPEPAAGSQSNPLTSIQRKLLEGKVIEVLSSVYDPEIPVNIYELGLIYGIDVADDNSIKVRMTLTAPACPVAGTLPGEVAQKIKTIPEVTDAEVELVWDPPWSKDRMSEAALLQLGLL
ncbi:MAG: SUF system Fe-S cluster assembly protein [Tepidisphaeraceae bacterium]